MTSEILHRQMRSFERDLDEASAAARAVMSLLWDVDVPAHIAVEKMERVRQLAGRCNREAAAFVTANRGADWVVKKNGS